jgi:hypothetical protein
MLFQAGVLYPLLSTERILLDIRPVTAAWVQDLAVLAFALSPPRQTDQRLASRRSE